MKPIAGVAAGLPGSMKTSPECVFRMHGLAKIPNCEPTSHMHSNSKSFQSSPILAAPLRGKGTAKVNYIAGLIEGHIRPV